MEAVPQVRELTIVLLHRVDKIDPVCCIEKRFLWIFLSSMNTYVRLSEIRQLKDMMDSMVPSDHIFDTLAQPPKFSCRLIQQGRLGQLLATR